MLVNPEVLEGYVSENEESDEDAVKVDQIEADEGMRDLLLGVHYNAKGCFPVRFDCGSRR